MGTSKDISDEGGGPAFTAPEERYTHDNKGGMYRCLGVGKQRPITNDKWEPAVFYQCVNTGALYATHPDRWNDKFRIMPGPGYINQDD